jgi:hypothetical protein
MQTKILDPGTEPYKVLEVPEEQVMGKYDAVIKKLRPIPGALREGGSSYQDKLQQHKIAILRERAEDEPTAAEELCAHLKDLVLAAETTLVRYKDAERPKGRTALYALEYRLLKDLEEAAEELAKQTREHMDARSQLLLDAMEDDGVTSLRLDDGSSLWDQPDVFATTKDPTDEMKGEENAATLKAWLREQGMEGLLTLHSATLLSMTKERLLAGEGPPPGVNVFFRPKVVLRRGRS